MKQREKRVVEGEGVASRLPRSKYVLFRRTFSPHVNKKKVPEVDPEDSKGSSSLANRLSGGFWK